MATFTDLIGGLAEQKRKARLQGRPISQNEVRGMTAGYFDAASQRLAQAKSLKDEREMAEARLATDRELQSERLASEQSLQAERLAEQKRAEQERIRLQEEQLRQRQDEDERAYQVAQQAQERGEKQNMINTALVGTAVAGQYGGSIIKGISSAFSKIGSIGK